MVLLFSFHWFVPVGLFLVFVTLSVVISFMHSIHAPLWTRVGTVERSNNKKTRVEKRIRAYENKYKDQENQIQKKDKLKAEEQVDKDFEKHEQNRDKLEDELGKVSSNTTFYVEQVETTVEDGKKRLQNIYNSRLAINRKGDLSKITTILVFVLLPFLFSACEDEARPIHTKCMIIDVSGSMNNQYKASELTRGILGHDFESGSLYEDGLSVIITTIGDNSNARKRKVFLPPTKGYWSVDEGKRKKEMEAFYADVLTAISKTLNSEDKRPMSYVNRSVSQISEHFGESGGELILLSDMSQENVFINVSFPSMFNKHRLNFLDHFDTMASAMKKDADYELENVDVSIVFTAPPEMDEYFRLCSKYWERFLIEKGANSVKTYASIDQCY